MGQKAIDLNDLIEPVNRVTNVIWEDVLSIVGGEWPRHFTDVHNVKGERWRPALVASTMPKFNLDTTKRVPIGIQRCSPRRQDQHSLSPPQRGRSGHQERKILTNQVST